MPLSGTGTPKEFKQHSSAKQLRSNAAAANKQLIHSLRRDPHVDELVKQIEADIALGRMSQLEPVPGDFAGVVFSSRFGILQIREAPHCCAPRP